MGYTGYVVWTLFCFISFILCYAQREFGYSLTYDGVVALFETNSAEISAFITPWLIGGMVLSVVVSVPLLYGCRKLVRLGAAKLRLLAGGLAVAGFMAIWFLPTCLYAVHPSIYMRSCSLTHKAMPEFYINGHYELAANNLRSPFSPIAKLFRYSYMYLAIKEDFNKVEEFESACDERIKDKLVVVLVIGESVRADHCSFNGYKRPTMDDVAGQPGFVALPSMWSYGNSTRISMDGILGGLHEPDSTVDMTSFAGLFLKHGFYTHFVSENTVCPLSSQRMLNFAGYAFKRKEGINAPIVDLAKRLCQEINSKADSPYLLVVENGTGHFPYTPEEAHRKFRPDQANYSNLKGNGEKIINDYDNCVYSINLFLATMMEQLKNRKAVLIYTSDHGQLLGEDGSWMHGTDRKEVRHVASFMWFSPAYEEACPEYVASLKAAAGQPHCHGQIFATLLNLAGISTKAPLLTEDLTHPAPEAAKVKLPAVSPAR